MDRITIRSDAPFGEVLHVCVLPPQSFVVGVARLVGGSELGAMEPRMIRNITPPQKMKNSAIDYRMASNGPCYAPQRRSAMS